jgi:SAM-dependent methyltransferase
VPVLETLSRNARRGANAWRRLRSGLPLRGGISPEVPNDLFQAHLALYVLAGPLARGKRVLDLGCGTGYGSARLAAAGAASVVGVDPDGKALAYARRRFAGPKVRFVAGAAEAVPGDLNLFDLIVAANLLAQLDRPAAALEDAARHLHPQGVFLASVPPIVDERTMEAHRAAAPHRSNLYLWDWESLLRRRFEDLRLFRLGPPEGARLDLADPAPSRLDAEAFHWEEIPLTRLAAAGSLAAVFLCTRPRP